VAFVHVSVLIFSDILTANLSVKSYRPASLDWPESDIVGYTYGFYYLKSTSEFLAAVQSSLRHILFPLNMNRQVSVKVTKPRKRGPSFLLAGVV